MLFIKYNSLLSTVPLSLSLYYTMRGVGADNAMDLDLR